MKDLTGQKFGRLTVLYHIDERRHNNKWACKCDCGSEDIKIVFAYDLINNKVKSCGCLRKSNAKKLSQIKRKENFVQTVGDITKIYDDNNNYTLIDTEDYSKIKDYYWSIKNGYWYNKELNNSLHRFLMNPSQDEEIDHINRNKNDNRKINLRIVTHSENGKNRSIQYNNKSGCTGVCYYAQTDKWRARITVNGETIYLGYYKNKDEAIKARKEAEEKYFGIYAPKQTSS